MIGKLSIPSLIQKQEENRLFLDTEKNSLKNSIETSWTSKQSFEKLISNYLSLLQDPTKIREEHDIKSKQLLIGVLIGSKIEYKKNQGFKTPDLSRLHLLFDTVSKADFVNGAVDGD